MSQWVDYRALKQSVGIAQVLSCYQVQVKPVGPDQLRGRCPLPTHGSERSRESFSVHTAKNVWACHSASCCAARQGRVGGNVLDLVALLQRCSIREAALQLQGGWPTENRPCEQLASKGSSSSPTPIRPLPFSLRLSWHPYLDHRGVHPATAARFGVGYYAGPGCLRGRMAFPIHDSEGRLVAYAGRSIDGPSRVCGSCWPSSGVRDCGGIVRLLARTPGWLPQCDRFDGRQPLGDARDLIAGALWRSGLDVGWRRSRAVCHAARLRGRISF